MRTGEWTDSLNFRAQLCEHVVQIKQCRRIAVSVGVSSCRHSVPRCVTCGIGIQARDDPVEDTDAVCLR